MFGPAIFPNNLFFLKIVETTKKASVEVLHEKSCKGCSQDGKMIYWNEYRGIRYARKPVRFEKPVPVASSSNTKMAKEYANMCVQYRKTGYNR